MFCNFHTPNTDPVKRAWSGLISVILLATIVFGCASPPPGTKYWVQAQRQFEKGDYADTVAYINDLLSHDTTYAERASAWKVLILGAMTRAAMEWEEACKEGVSFVPQWESRDYKICIEQYRRQTKTRVLALLEALAIFNQVTQSSETVLLAFPLPNASTVPSPILRRIKVGNMPNEDIREAAAARTLDRHFIRQSQDAIGVEDPIMAKNHFVSFPVKTTKAQFLLGVAHTLQQGAAVFNPGRLDDRTRKKLVLEHAHKCLQPALKSSDKTMKTVARTLARKTRG